MIIIFEEDLILEGQTHKSSKYTIMKSMKIVSWGTEANTTIPVLKDEWIIPKRMGEVVFKENRFVRGKLMSKGHQILGEGIYVTVSAS